MSSNTGAILLVEDDPDDAFFLQHAFQNAGISNPLLRVDDGQDAIDYLAGQGKFGDRSQFPFPCLVLLDLKLPRRMGLDVLRWVREQPDLQTLLVVVLTSSKHESEIDECYRLGARAYVVKPLTMAERQNLVKCLKSFWLDLNQPPSVRDPHLTKPQAAKRVVETSKPTANPRGMQ